MNIPTRVTCWYGRIKPHERNSRNLSDGAIFVNRTEAERFARGVIGGGGKILRIEEIPDAMGFWLSVEEMNAPHTSEELRAIAQRKAAPALTTKYGVPIPCDGTGAPLRDAPGKYSLTARAMGGAAEHKRIGTA